MGREGARYIQKKIHDGYVTGRRMGESWVKSISIRYERNKGCLIVCSENTVIHYRVRINAPLIL